MEVPYVELESPLDPGEGTNPRRRVIFEVDLGVPRKEAAIEGFFLMDAFRGVA